MSVFYDMTTIRAAGCRNKRRISQVRHTRKPDSRQSSRCRETRRLPILSQYPITTLSHDRAGASRQRNLPIELYPDNLCYSHHAPQPTQSSSPALHYPSPSSRSFPPNNHKPLILHYLLTTPIPPLTHPTFHARTTSHQWVGQLDEQDTGKRYRGRTVNGGDAPSIYRAVARN